MRCEAEELVAVRPSISTKSFLNVAGNRFGSAAKLCGVRQATTLEQLVDIVYNCSCGVEYAQSRPFRHAALNAVR